MLEKINQTAEYLRSRVSDMPATAIILGTGLGPLVDHITDNSLSLIVRSPISPFQR